MQATQLFYILLISFFVSAAASAQVFDSGPSDPSLFDSVINLPGDDAPDRIGSLANPTQLNVSSGGSVENGLTAWEGGELNISGGSVGNGLFAIGGEVNISDGSVGVSFNARDGSMINISGGSVGCSFGADSGSEVNISGGSVGRNFSAFDGGEVNISGGSVGNGFDAFDGSVVNIDGGSVGDGFRAFDGSTVNLFGSDFILDGVLLDDLVTGEAFTILDRNVTLSGQLADGSAFSFDLNFGDASSADRFFPDAVLTVTLTNSVFLCQREVPDQEFMPPSNSGTNLTSGGDDPFAIRQTFTVGRSGNLNRVELLISYIGGFDPVPSDGLDVEIFTNPNLTSTPTRLGFVHVHHLMIPTSEESREGQRVSVDLTSLDIAVTEGDMLAITVSSPSKESYTWWHRYGYGGGEAVSLHGGEFSQPFQNRDFGFRTFVKPSIAGDPNCLLLGDCNQDGAIDFLDISPFIAVLSSNTHLEQADCNQDGGVNFLDISPFITILSGSN